MTLSVIIPTFNEKKTILEILKRIEAVDLGDISFKKEIIIVDDKSTDGTRDILRNIENRYKIVYRSENGGKGAAIITGLESVSGDYVIIQDADLEYDPRDYKIMLECAVKNNAEVVYGSRRLNHQNKYSHLSFYLGGILLTWITKILYGINITDESTCYKLFKTQLIKSLSLETKGFDFCPEVTAKIARKKIKIYEVPISYHPRHKNEGKKISWLDGIKAIFVLIKYRF